MKRLPEFDARYEKLKEEAKAEGKVLRYAGVVDVQSKTVKAALEKCEFRHACRLGVTEHFTDIQLPILLPRRYKDRTISSHSIPSGIPSDR